MSIDEADNFSIMGESDEIKSILMIAERIASTDVSVLITGESGTGKELLARFIVSKSKRKEEKFVAINCAAIPEALLENELFGHKKGAYTDAKDDYIGKLGYANGGTVFLDEISEMDLALQAKLLRVLQFKEFEPVGSIEIYRTDVRVIAATNSNILKLIKENKFREDLYYRLNVVPIHMPSLRNRGNDIEVLANFFLKMYNRKNEKQIKGFSSGIITILKEYHWPGNVRELRNVIERAVVLCNTDFIQREDIVIQSNFSGIQEIEDNVKTLKEAIDDFKREYLIKILEKNGWNQTYTAKVLNIQRTYLSRLIRELKIDKI